MKNRKGESEKSLLSKFKSPHMGVPVGVSDLWLKSTVMCGRADILLVFKRITIKKQVRRY